MSTPTSIFFSFRSTLCSSASPDLIRSKVFDSWGPTVDAGSLIGLYLKTVVFHYLRFSPRVSGSINRFMSFLALIDFYATSVAWKTI